MKSNSMIREDDLKEMEHPSRLFYFFMGKG